MIYYCSECAPFTSVQQKHIQQLMKEKGEVTILFLNDSFQSEQTKRYFQTIFADIGSVLPYMQLTLEQLSTLAEPIFFDGLLADRLQLDTAAGSILSVEQTYGYELLPFSQTHVFDDVSKAIADFIIDQQVFGIDRDMGRVYQHMHYARFQHTMRVRYLIAQLASKHQLNVQNAQFAALFHDYAKELPESELAAIMQNDFSDYLDAPSAAWHGFAGAKIVEDLYGRDVRHALIYEAIEFHTVGKAHYAEIGLALFIADFCDYRRPFRDVTESVWALAQESLYEAARVKILTMTAYLAKNEKEIYRTTQDMLRWLTEKLNGKKGDEQV